MEHLWCDFCCCFLMQKRLLLNVKIGYFSVVTSSLGCLTLGFVERVSFWPPLKISMGITDLFCFQCTYIDSKSSMEEVWSFLADKNHWDLPKLLISVTGGAQAFAAMQHRLKELIKGEIVSAATKTGIDHKPAYTPPSPPPPPPPGGGFTTW